MRILLSKTPTKMLNALIQTEIFVIFLALLIGSTERDGGKPASEELKLS
jgi:hypothetical protein